MTCCFDNRTNNTGSDEMRDYNRAESTSRNLHMLSNCFYYNFEFRIWLHVHLPLSSCKRLFSLFRYVVNRILLFQSYRHRKDCLTTWDASFTVCQEMSVSRDMTCTQKVYSFWLQGEGRSHAGGQVHVAKRWADRSSRSVGIPSRTVFGKYSAVKKFACRKIYKKFCTHTHTHTPTHPSVRTNKKTYSSPVVLLSMCNVWLEVLTAERTKMAVFWVAGLRRLE
jgi:hypothetical protein